jgi:hypothetical protein
VEEGIANVPTNLTNWHIPRPSLWCDNSRCPCHISSEHSKLPSHQQQRGSTSSQASSSSNTSTQVQTASYYSHKYGTALFRDYEKAYTELHNRAEDVETFRTFQKPKYNKGPPPRSSGESSWMLTQRSRVRFPAQPYFLSSSGSGTGSTQPL